METRRFILLLAIALVGMMLWQAWQLDHEEPEEPGRTTPARLQPGQVPGVPDESGDIPEGVSFDSPLAGETPSAEPAGESVRVETDVLSATVALRGGTLSELALTQYPIRKDAPDRPVRLLFQDAENSFHIAQSGLLSRQAEAAPQHNARYRSEHTHYRLSEGEDELRVELYWQSAQGVEVTKTLLFQRGSYHVAVRYQIYNGGQQPWVGRAYGQLQRTAPRDGKWTFIYTYTGAVVSTPDERYEKIDFDDIREEKMSVDTENGWVAMLQHYFVAAMIPADKASRWHYYTTAVPKTDSHIIGGISPSRTIAPGDRGRLGHSLYLGPKVQKVLKPIAEGLELTVDYGFLWFIGILLFGALELLQALVGNWGWAIVLLTLILKLLFYKLSAIGYRSMAHMRRLQPRITALRNRFAKDRQQLNKAVMQMYREEKINPVGGCFPILIQIPVFIALYWVLIESVEMRQAEFIFWIDDLSAHDSYFVLPVIMGFSLWVQQKLNPPPMDPVQEKVLSFLPLVFGVLFAFCPSGLVLYWVVNNILSIGQQWLITRGIEKGARPSSLTKA